MLRAFLWALVGSLCVSALLAIAALLSGDFSTTEERILLSTLAFGAASGLSLAASVGCGRAHPLAAGTVVSAAVLLVLALIEIWGDLGGGEATEELAGTLAVLASSGAYLSLLLGLRRDDDGGRVLAAHWPCSERS